MPADRHRTITPENEAIIKKPGGTRRPAARRFRSGPLSPPRARAPGRRELVLGAWGCGVFRNDPDTVATAFHRLPAAGGPFEGRFARAVFAVLDRAPQAPSRASFQAAFAGI